MPWISPVRRFGALRIPELVERGDRGVVEHAHRWHEWRYRDELVRAVRERGDLLGRASRSASRAWSPRLQHAAAEMAALGDEVDPGDAVPHVVVAVCSSWPAARRGRRRAKCRHRIRLVSIGIRRIVASIITPVRPMPPTVAQNSAGLWSGPITVVEPSASIIVIDIDVVADRPVDVMVLAVDVAGDRTADRHEPGAGRDRHEEARAARSTRSSSSMLTPAPTVTRPVQRIEDDVAGAGGEPHAPVRRRSARRRRSYARGRGPAPRAGPASFSAAASPGGSRRSTSSATVGLVRPQPHRRAREGFGTLRDPIRR